MPSVHNASDIISAHRIRRLNIVRRNIYIMIHAIINNSLCASQSISLIRTCFSKILVEANFIKAPTTGQERQDFVIVFCPSFMRISQIVYPEECHNKLMNIVKYYQDQYLLIYALFRQEIVLMFLILYVFGYLKTHFRLPQRFHEGRKVL